MKMQHHRGLLPAVSTLLSVPTHGTHWHFSQSLGLHSTGKAAVAGGGITGRHPREGGGEIQASPG